MNQKDIYPCLIIILTIIIAYLIYININMEMNNNE